MNNSFRRTIIGSLCFMALLSLIVGAALALFLLIRHGNEEDQSRIRAEEQNLIGLGVLDLINLVEFQELVDQLSSTIEPSQLNEIIHIYKPPGSVLYTNVPGRTWREPRIDLLRHVDKGFYVFKRNHREYLAQLRSYETSDGKILWLQIATPRTNPWTTLRSVLPSYLILLLALLAIAFIVAFFIARNIGAPLDDFAKAIAKLDTADARLWTTLPQQRHLREVRPIVQEINRLMERVQRAFVRSEYLGRFIAHEIRTPLTIIQGEVETVLSDSSIPRAKLDEALRSTLEEVSRISNVVETVLRISQGDRNSTPVQLKETDILEWLTHFQKQISESIPRPIRWSIGKVDHRKVLTDPDLFSLLLHNLIRNADRHTSQTSIVEVLVEAEPENLVVSVNDSGPGLPEDVMAVANSPQPFSPELGIGLILTKQIASLIQLKLTFVNRAPFGLSVEIRSAFTTSK